MEKRNKKPDDVKQRANDDTSLVASYGLLLITRAYNRKEITFDEWLRQSKEWAERIIRQYSKSE